MHKSESFQEEMHKILRGFEIQREHLILARKPDLVFISKKKNKKKPQQICAFCLLADCRTQQCTTTRTVTIITSNTYLRSSIVKTNATDRVGIYEQT